MSDVERKCVGAGCELRDQGAITAIVATLDTIDRDRDIIPSDAFPTGVKVKLSAYGHSSISDLMYGTGIPDDPPVGKGALIIERGKAVFRGKYFLSTAAGREAFNVAKEMGDEQEWSFGYRILKTLPPSDDLAAKGARRVLAKLEPLEVSPVLYAGGVGTQTVATKRAGRGDCPTPSWIELSRRVAAIKRKAELVLGTCTPTAWARATARNWATAVEQELGLEPATIRWSVADAKAFGEFNIREPDVIRLRPGLLPHQIGRTVVHEEVHRFRVRHGLPDPEPVVERDTEILLRKLA